MAGTENRVQQAGKLFPKAGLLLMESAISKVEYEKLLAEIKQRIRSAQTRAALAVNRELVLLYWQIGREIVERQSREGWGAKVIERLAADLGREFPEVEGFGARNLRNMRDLAREWPDGEKLCNSLLPNCRGAITTKEVPTLGVCCMTSGLPF